MRSVKWMLLALLVAAPLLVRNPVGAQPAATEPRVLGHIGGAVRRVAAQGSVAYAAAGPRLQVLDLTDPTSPRLVGESSPASYVIEDLVVAGRYVYAAAGMAGMRVFDVGDPARPLEVAATSPPGYFASIAVEGGRAYLVGGGGLRVYDVSDPARPVELGAHLGIQGVAAAVSGNYLYVAGYDANGYTMQVWYVAYPEDIARVGVYQPPRYTGAVKAIALGGRYAYLAEDPSYVEASGTYVNGGLRVLDVADPTRPTPLGLAQVPGYLNDVAAVGDRAYLTAGNRSVGAGNPDERGGLHVFDVRDPARPVEIGGPQLADFSALAVTGTTALVVDPTGLHVVDTTRSVEVGGYSAPPAPSRVFADGSFAYALEGSTLRIVDATDPVSPRLRGSVVLPADAADVVAAGGYAYALVRGEMRVVDARNPAAPRDLGVAGGATIAGLALGGRYIYAAAGASGLRVYDLADPTRPTLVRAVSLGSAVDAVVVEGRALVVQTPGGYRLLDLTDPAAPAEGDALPAKPVDYAQPSGASIGGGYAFLGWSWTVLHGFDAGVQTIDLSDPRVPRPVPGYPEKRTPFARADGTAVFAWPLDWDFASTRLRVWRDPGCPALAGSLTLPGRTIRMSESGGRLYAAAGEMGLYVLETPTAGGTCRRVHVPMAT